MRSQNEHTLYKKIEGNDRILLVWIYVYDIVYLISSQTLVENFRHDMKKTFEMSDLGLLNYFLGLEMRRRKNVIFVI